MKKDAVFCTAANLDQADYIVSQLRAVGFPSDDISVLTSDRRSTRDFAYEKNTKAPEGAVAGAGAGGLLGGALGLLAGIGALAIPGLGPLIAAGPIMAALSGAAVGAAGGTIVGTLVGLGIPEYEAKRYEGLVQKGHVLISVHVETHDEKNLAKDALRIAGAQDIGSAGEVPVPTAKPSRPSNISL